MIGGATALSANPSTFDVILAEEPGSREVPHNTFLRSRIGLRPPG